MLANMPQTPKQTCLKGLEELKTLIEQVHDTVAQGKLSNEKTEQLVGWLAGKADGLLGILAPVPKQANTGRQRGFKMETVFLPD
jgi:hypothetical protein